MADDILVLRAASSGQTADLSSRGDEDRIVVIFSCVVGRRPSVSVKLDRSQVLAELQDAGISRTPSCDDTKRCCTFPRDPKLAKQQKTVDKACFSSDGAVTSLQMIDEDACRG